MNVDEPIAEHLLKEAADAAEKELKLTLIGRYAYLKYGGRWDAEVKDLESYLAGFEDALKTLGLKP